MNANVEDRAARRARARRTRLIVYGSLAAALWSLYVWVPWNIDFIPRKPPNPNAPIDPDSALLFSGKAKVLIVTAHPDDSAFYIGGFLTRLAASGTEIHQVICTDGDKGYYPFEDWRENRRVRRLEALAEARKWGGVDILFLGEPDGRLRNNDRLVDAIKRTLIRVQPDYLLCFDSIYPPGMSHQDHRRAGEAALKAALETRIPTWIMQFSTIAPNFIVDVSNQWDAQQQLLQIHSSQFHGKRLEMITGMVGEHALDEGKLRGYLMGEGFRCVKLR